MIIGFDLDGTLIDSLGITLDFLLDSVLRVTGQKMAPEQISRHFGHPEERALTWALAGDEKLAHRVLNDYVETLRGHQDRIQLFRGVAEGLTELSKFITEKNKKNTSQVSLALYTARGRKATEVLFVYHKMDRWFQNWITGSDLQEGKPHPQGLQMLLDRAPGAVAQGSIYIGDSPKDVQMAKSLGFLSIGVAWCRHVEKDALEAAHPDLIFDDPRELFKFLVEKVRAL